MRPGPEMQKAAECDEYVSILKYLNILGTNIYSDTHSHQFCLLEYICTFAREIFLYEYIRTFVRSLECVRVSKLEYSYNFEYKYLFRYSFCFVAN